MEVKIKEPPINLLKELKLISEYVPVRIVNILFFCSAQDSIKEGSLVYIGEVGKKLTLGYCKNTRN